MNFLLDGVIIGICLLCVLVGVQRGFIRSVVHFLGAVIAACLATTEARMRTNVIKRKNSSITASTFRKLIKTGAR